MTLHVRVSIAIYYQLYKVTSQVSPVTALIEQDNFLYLSSFMDKYFSGNAFKFLILINLLTVNKRVLNLAGSLARSESHLLRVVIGCSPLMSHLICVVIGCSPVMSHLICVVIGCSPVMSHLICVVIGCSPVMSHLICVVIGCSPLMSHIHVHTLH